LTSALDGGEWSASRPGRFTPRERAADTHWIGWVAPEPVWTRWRRGKFPASARTRTTGHSARITQVFVLSHFNPLHIFTV